MTIDHKPAKNLPFSFSSEELSVSLAVTVFFLSEGLCSGLE